MSNERHHQLAPRSTTHPRHRRVAWRATALWQRWRLPAAVFVVVFVTLPAVTHGASAATLRTYKVAPGDNLTVVARRFDVTLAELRNVNDLRSDGRIVIGQRLKVPPSSAAKLPSRLRANSARLALRPHFVTWANRNVIPTDLLEATLWLESGWNQTRISSTGAIGIGQLMPRTAAFIASDLIGKNLDPHDAHDNIRMSARYLRFLLNMYRGDTTKALQAYYQGIGSIRANGVYPSTTQYSDAVQALRVRFRSDHTGR